MPFDGDLDGRSRFARLASQAASQTASPDPSVGVWGASGSDVIEKKTLRSDESWTKKSEQSIKGTRASSTWSMRALPPPMLRPPVPRSLKLLKLLKLLRPKPLKGSKA